MLVDLFSQESEFATMQTKTRWKTQFRRTMAIAVLSSSAPCLAAVADEPEKEVESKVVSVALFKNGLAVVKRQVPLQGVGVYRIADVPEAVHGTFLVESNGPIEARVETRQVASQAQPPLGLNLQDELTGLKVTIHGRTSKTPMMGTVMGSPRANPDSAVQKPLTASLSVPAYPTPSRFLLLKTEKGISYVDLSEIASLEAEGQPQPREPLMEIKPVLLLDARTKTMGNTAEISYLAHGLSWAPSYKVELIDAKRLSIEQDAIIRNELADLSDTEVSVISGYPSVQFGEVVSPLAPTQTWARFFQQLGNKSGAAAFNNSFITQNSAYNMRGSNGGGAEPTLAPNVGDTIDLHYHSVGKRSLKKGDAMSFSTGIAQVGYERIVEWTIPDNRDEWGAPNNNRRVDPMTGAVLQDDVWDALTFKNTLPFPMTSAPAMVISAGKFSGQGQVLWTNKNEEATLRVNKALSIRARHVEYENQVAEPAQSERDIIYLGGRRFRKVTVNGELRLCNNRPSMTKMIIKRQFSGDYVKGDDTPKIDLREEGVWTVNKRNELTWTLSMKPAEERTVKFQYTVLINF